MTVYEEELGRARRRLTRSVAAKLIACMAQTDASPELIAARIGVSPAKVWRTLTDLIEGRGDITLGQLADFSFAMGAEISVELVPAAQAIEARRAETAEQAPSPDESAVGEADAPVSRHRHDTPKES
jgi:hypothetical protein